MQVVFTALPQISYVLLSIVNSGVKTSQPFTLVNSTSFVASLIKLKPQQAVHYETYSWTPPATWTPPTEICATNTFDKMAKDLKEGIRPWMKQGYIITAAGEQEAGKEWVLLMNDPTSQAITLHLSKWSSKYVLQSELRLVMSKECAETMSKGVRHIAGVDVINLLDRTIIKDKLQSHSVVDIQVIDATTTDSYGRNVFAMRQLKESHLWMILQKNSSV